MVGWLVGLNFSHAWQNFRKALPNDEDKQAFEEIMDMARNNAMVVGNACNSVSFEPNVMSMLLGQQKRIRTLNGN